MQQLQQQLAEQRYLELLQQQQEYQLEQQQLQLLQQQEQQREQQQLQLLQQQQQQQREQQQLQLLQQQQEMPLMTKQWSGPSRRPTRNEAYQRTRSATLTEEYSERKSTKIVTIV
jgi:hypothetical protein